MKLRKCWNCRVYCVGIACFDCVRAVGIGVAIAYIVHKLF
jgi:hypothetical protein